MRYTFGNDNLITGYIKNLLHEFNLPKAKVLTEDTIRYDGKYYIKDRKIFYGKSNKQIGVYTFNAMIPNLTKNLIIDSSVYDSYTHAYLGDFLRFIRDYHKLDLMPLYNCFNNEMPYDLMMGIELDDGNYFMVNTSNSSYKYYIVPIKFDAEYNIAIESNVPYEICAMFYTGSQKLKISNELVKETYKRISSSSFSAPYKFKVAGDDTYKEFPTTRPHPGDELRYTDYEDTLRLLIKLPKSVNSSIVVLEGNISGSQSYMGKIPTRMVYNEEEFIKDKNGELVHRQDYKDIPFNSALSLLAINDGESYPFADRLVEYLLRHAINNTEMLQYNVGRVQDTIYKNDIKFKGYYDIWNKDLNYRIHDIITKPETRSIGKIYQAVMTSREVPESSESGETKTVYEYETDSEGNIVYDTKVYSDGVVDYTKSAMVDTYKDMLNYVDKEVEYYLEAQ